MIREVCTLSFDNLIHLDSHCNDAQLASLCAHGHLGTQHSRNIAPPWQDTELEDWASTGIAQQNPTQPENISKRISKPTGSAEAVG